MFAEYGIECIIKNYCSDFDEIILFLHRTQGIYFPPIGSSFCEKAVREYRYGGDNLEVAGVDYNLKQLLDRLERKEVITHEEFFFIDEKLKNIIRFLTPLHLSLQSFWGITTTNANENKLTFAQIGNNKNSEQFADAIRQKLDSTSDRIDEQYLSLFPNPEAFLLVDEAEYDFYAPLFDMVLSPEDKGKDENGKSKRGMGEFKLNTEDFEDGDPEKKAYAADTFSELLQKTRADRYQKLIEAFNTKIGDSWQAVDLSTEFAPEEVWFSIEIKDRNPVVVTFQLFVDCLRELGAILANTKSYGRLKKGCARNGYFGYKGKKEFMVLRDMILKSINLDGSENEHCKLEEYKEEYDKLVHQLSTWGIEKAMIVLGGISKLGILF